MPRSSSVLLSDTSDLWNSIGNPVKADGWFGLNNSLHTVSIQTQNLIGRVYIEGTLQLRPTDQDWFAIPLRNQLPYIEYPLDPANPTGINGGDTGITAYNFRGNFMFVRARLDRTYIFPDPPSPFDIVNYGKVVLILLN